MLNFWQFKQIENCFISLISIVFIGIFLFGHTGLFFQNTLIMDSELPVEWQYFQDVPNELKFNAFLVLTDREGRFPGGFIPFVPYSLEELSGKYDGQFNTIFLNLEQYTDKTVYHEYGHAFYGKALTRDEKDYWNYLYENDGRFIEDYAMTNAKEDFAETFAYYIKYCYLEDYCSDLYDISPVKFKFMKEIINEVLDG